MKKLISIFLVASLMLCIFAGCSKKDDTNEESTVSTTEKQPETSDETESSSTEPETSSTETETEKPTEKATTAPATPKLQYYKTYSSGHKYDSEMCREITLLFEKGNQVQVTYNFTAVPTYQPEEGEEEPLVHQHNGVKYYEHMYGGGAGYDTYTVSGNKVTIQYEGTFTIISDNSIKDSSGHVYKIID